MAKLPPAEFASSEFITTAPTDQNIVDIFQGEWSSNLPNLNAVPGQADLFRDPRLEWAHEVLDVSNRSVVELGPLEAAHTYMLLKMGARSVVAIEGNRKAFLKCLCVKEIFDLTGAKFLLGDFIRYLDETVTSFDVAIASGVLYHMVDPIKLLTLLASRANAVFIWTHYYDWDVLQHRDDRNLFSPLESLKSGDKQYSGATKFYAKAALKWGGFSGGPETRSVWLTRESLLRFFTDAGFDVQTAFEQPDHQNGPALALCAKRK